MKENASKLIALILTIALFTLPAQAYSIVDENSIQEHVENSMTAKTITVCSIDSLLEQRTSALLRNDHSLYDEISDTLNTYGVRRVFIDEVRELIGSNTLH